jgi:hypothetical protein
MLAAVKNTFRLVFIAHLILTSYGCLSVRRRFSSLTEPFSHVSNTSPESMTELFGRSIVILATQRWWSCTPFRGQAPDRPLAVGADQLGFGFVGRPKAIFNDSLNVG